MKRAFVIVLGFGLGCGSESAATSDAGALDSAAPDGAWADVATDAPVEAGAESGVDAGAPAFTLITKDHRFIAGKMFGGWGPHLGHLARTANGDEWFVDDVCTQTPNQPDTCDVLHNRTLGYFHRASGTWKEVTRRALPGDVQQNTATVVLPNGSNVGTKLATFGIDVAGHLLDECVFDTVAQTGSCTTLPFALGAAANYVGAAVSPSGAVVVWWTEVKDGGGGTFHYVVDYGGGWNGPRSGLAAGYNDSSYAHVTFGAGGDAAAMTWHTQLVSGLAPNWTFLGAVGSSSLTTTTAVTFQNALTPPPSDTVVSTNDVLTDPLTGDVHLLARTNAGLAVYYHLPSGGSWSAPSFSVTAYRARLLMVSGALVLAYGKTGGALGLRVARAKDRAAKTPIAWAALPETLVPLPQGFGSVYAIYPEAPMYQNVASTSIELALVGSATESEVLGLSLPLP